MPIVKDQLDRSVAIDFTPRRIISLVPSQTELLYDLGLSSEVVGITKFCIHPATWFKTKKRVGGTKKVDFEIINSLRPDLIIGNKEENDRTQLEELMKHYPVWMSDIKNLNEALDMISCLGIIVDKKEKAREIMQLIQQSFRQLEQNTVKSCAYFIWKKPYMCAGSNTFIDDLLRRCKLQNVFSHLGRYPEIKLDDLKQNPPDVILLSSEPYPFVEKDKNEIQKVCPNSKIEIVDGELFSWYGSRLLQSVSYFNSLFKKFN